MNARKWQVRAIQWAWILILGLWGQSSLLAQTFQAEVSAGENFEKAQFRLWIEPDTALRGLLVLVPGSNGDGRTQVDDQRWQTFARPLGLGLVGVRFTDRKHENMAIEHYVDVRRGSGAALENGLLILAQSCGKKEFAKAPLLLWGMSAGGQFNYEFALWKPERVIGFVVNKGGIYYNAIASPDARAVPGLFFMGDEDLEFRNDILRGVYSVNRRFQSQWALVVEPQTAHVVGRSRDLAELFFEEILDQRLAPGTRTGLRPLPYSSGFLGDPKTGKVTPAKDGDEGRYPHAWLPSQFLAQAWQAVRAKEALPRRQ